MAGLRSATLVDETGIPGEGPFLLKQGEVFEQRADTRRLPQVLVMQQPGVPPVSRRDAREQDKIRVLLGEETRQRRDPQFIGHRHGAGCDAVDQMSAFQAQ